VALASGGARTCRWCWVLVVFVRRRSPPVQTPTTEIDCPGSPYVANVCFRCFSRFKDTLQLFLMDVAEVDRRCCTCCICCKCFRGMLQAFVQNVSYVPDVRCKHFDLDVCICFHTYVAKTCSICFICFRHMLQVFYLDVVYITMTMLQVYISNNVSSVLIVCCNCFTSECCKGRSQCRAV
jgi:hypothetical protein